MIKKEAHNGKIAMRTPRAAAYAKRREETAALAAKARERTLVRPEKAATLLVVLDAYVAELRKKGQDADSVESAVGCWIGPALGHLPPEECDAAHLSSLIDVMRDAGRAPNTIRTRCAFVKSALSFALRARLIDRHPLPDLRGVLPPKRSRINARAEVLSIPSIEKLCCSPRVPHRERVMWLVSVTCGLRVAELIELRLGDIDRDAHYVNVDGDRDGVDGGAALHVTRQYRRKRKTIGPTKSGGPRTIALRPDVLAVIDDWIERGWSAEFGRDPGLGDLLFPANEPDHKAKARVRSGPHLGTRHQDDRKVLKRFHRDLASVGLAQRREHSLRHTFRVLLIEAGVPEDVAEQFLHPSPVTPAQIYAHYSYRVLHAAVRKIPLRLRVPSEQYELFALGAYSTHPQRQHSLSAPSGET